MTREELDQLKALADAAFITASRDAVPQLIDALQQCLAAETAPAFAVPRSPKWAATRAAHLAEHPTCEACGTAKMCEVHHVQPFHTHPERELDPGNLITLCESPSHNCHLIFGHLLNWASWNTSVREDAAAFRERVEKRPHEQKGTS